MIAKKGSEQLNYGFVNVLLLGFRVWARALLVGGWKKSTERNRTIQMMGLP